MSLKKYHAKFAHLGGGDRGYVYFDADNRVAIVEPIPGLESCYGFNNHYLGETFEYMSRLYFLELICTQSDRDLLIAKIEEYRSRIQCSLEATNRLRLSEAMPIDMKLKWVAEGRLFAVDEIINIIKVEL